MPKIVNWHPKSHVRMIGADTFFYMLEMTKMLHLSGRFGGGKTAGAYIIGSWLYANGKVDQIMSNIPDAVSVTVKAPVNRSAIILDEAWQYISDWTNVKAYAAYLRKLSLIMLMPSVFPPNARMRVLTCYRVFDAHTIGIPLWVYHWDLSVGGVREKGLFGILNPAGVFGMFDTNFIPTDDGGIVQAIDKTVLSLTQGRTPPTTTPPVTLEETRVVAKATAKKRTLRRAQMKADISSEVKNAVTESVKPVISDLEASQTDQGDRIQHESDRLLDRLRRIR